MKEKRRGEESESIKRGSKGVLDAFRKYFVVEFGIECGKSRSLTSLLEELRVLSVIPVSNPSLYIAASRC
jgi:hypothetical protein